jgi:hypothetical protein
MTINLNIKEHIYKYFFIYKFLFIYLEIHHKDCQNNPLSMKPHSYTTKKYIPAFTYSQKLLENERDDRKIYTFNRPNSKSVYK